MDESKDIVKLQTDPLKIGDIVDLVVSPSCGAISTFSGTTRDNFEDKRVVELEYEAYEPMAVKEMRNICVKIREQWVVERIAIFHRLGIVPVTEASVIIAISSPHRQDSLEATRYAIDTLKASVPIWKKEIYDTEDGKWKENKECPWSPSNREIKIQEDRKIGQTPIKTEKLEIEKNKIPDAIDPNLVQIRASSEDLSRRIEAFIARKREQVNLVNVQEFCCHSAKYAEEESSCARVDAILIRRKDSKSHVRVHRVMNPWGPQMGDPLALQKPPSSASSQNSPVSYPPALEERLATSEGFLKINGPVPKNVYERLKRLEDRILYLESVSPEYRNFWTGPSDNSMKPHYKPVRKRTFSRAELDSKLHELENKYAKRAH